MIKKRRANIQLLVNLTTVFCFTGGHPICYMKKKIYIFRQKNYICINIFKHIHVYKYTQKHIYMPRCNSAEAAPV